ncbi:MAG: alpha/beta hydrolase [Myxococcota bacterium]
MLCCWSALAHASPVSLTAADGATLSAERYGAGKRGVVLVHDEARSRADYATLAPRLASAGYLVIAVDLRGHGASSPGPLTEADWPKLVADVGAAIGWLGHQGATEVHLVGTGLGANLAVNAAADTPAVTDLVLLSPTPARHGVRIAGAAEALGTRPVLVVASTDDVLSLKAATWLTGAVGGPTELATYTGAGSGARMLAAAPDLEGRILGWLAAPGQKAERAALPSKAGELQGAEIAPIERSGERIEDRTR